MKILIVGSSGFIGKHLSNNLIRSGYQVAGLDIAEQEPQSRLNNFILGDVLDKNAILRTLEGAEAVIHLVAKHHDFGISRDEFYNVNVLGTKNILDCATLKGVKKFIFYSTVAVYGNVKEFSVETMLPSPVSVYGKTKLAAEELLCKWVKEDKERMAVVIRPTIVFGPGNFANMFNLIDKIYSKKFVFVGKGKNIKSVAYVENLVAATIFLLQRMQPGTSIYNYSDYPQMTIEQIVKTISQYVPSKVPKFKVPLKPVLAITGTIDILGKLTGRNFPITANRIKKFNTSTLHGSDKIRREGFKPPVELSEGFRRMVNWYLSSGSLRPNYRTLEAGGED